MSYDKTYTMKRTILLILLALTLTPAAFASGNNSGNGELLHRITNRLIFSEAEKETLGDGLAVVSFTINNQGCIEIVQVDASTEEQKAAVTEKLQGFFIENAPVATNAVYSIQVHFNRSE